jgi:hypothetical protein
MHNEPSISLLRTIHLAFSHHPSRIFASSIHYLYYTKIETAPPISLRTIHVIMSALHYIHQGSSTPLGLCPNFTTHLRINSGLRLHVSMPYAPGSRKLPIFWTKKLSHHQRRATVAPREAILATELPLQLSVGWSPNCHHDCRHSFHRDCQLDCHPTAADWWINTTSPRKLCCEAFREAFRDRYANIEASLDPYLLLEGCVAGLTS